MGRLCPASGYLTDSPPPTRCTAPDPERGKAAADVASDRLRPYFHSADPGPERADGAEVEREGTLVLRIPGDDVRRGADRDLPEFETSEGRRAAAGCGRQRLGSGHAEQCRAKANDLRLLSDLELVLCGGGDGGICW